MAPPVKLRSEAYLALATHLGEALAKEMKLNFDRSGNLLYGLGDDAS
jgi:hypothetical protein